MWYWLITFGLVFLIYWALSKPKDFPPGPPRLPLIGSLPFLHAKKQPLFYRAIEETGERWGCRTGIMGLYFGSQPSIAIWNPKIIREVLQRDEFQGRPDGFLVRARSFGKKRGIFFSDGPSWAEQRRFTLNHLRDLGVLGLHKVQHHVQEEITELIERIKNHPEGHLRGSRIVPVNGLFSVHIINIMWALLSGKRYSHDDIKLQQLLKLLSRMIRTGEASGGILNAVPWLRFILPGFSQYNNFMETFTALQNFTKDTIEEHKAALDKNNIEDFIDAYLLEMETHSSEKKPSFNDEELITICMDLFAAGSESVGNTLSFALLYLGHHPNVQTRLWEECKKELGVGCCPCLEDRSRIETMNAMGTRIMENPSKIIYTGFFFFFTGFSIFEAVSLQLFKAPWTSIFETLRLPYLQAVLEEVMRINPVAPLAPPHRATQETSLAGYYIPKDSALYLSLWAASHDESKWKEPYKFLPERFIDENGLFIRDEVSLNFGFGKRQCPGMSFSRNAIFLFLGALVANYEFQFAPDDPSPSTLSLPGFSGCPQPFNILAIKRQQNGV